MRLGFGSSRLHLMPFESDRRRLIWDALDLGIAHFDTSPFYGYGLAEKALGAALQGRRDVSITTKVGLYAPAGASDHFVSIAMRKAVGRLIARTSRPVADYKPQMAERSLEKSLRALRVERVDFLLLHEPRVTRAESDDLIAWVLRATERGMVRAWGVAAEAELCSRLIEDDPRWGSTVQTGAGKGWEAAERLRRTGVAIHFLYGALRENLEPTTGSPGAVIAEAMARFPECTVLASTRQGDRLRQLALAARKET
ncbi:MAG: aldo/keto reductase [Anaeromyxobacteraceae bacterium]